MAAPTPLQLAPLATAQGLLQAKIVDAHLAFDADVTVPIAAGAIDFERATVEHVGPDSRMGVSEQGLYVDAPNGRSELYRFPATPMPGVAYEKRGALPGSRAVTGRGSLRLREFAEALLQDAVPARGLGITEPARLLLDRTSVSGFVQLGDGPFALPGVAGELTGASVRSNLLRLHAQAAGRGITLEIASLHARDIVLQQAGARVECGDATGALVVRVQLARDALRYEVDVSKLVVSGIRIRPA